MIDNVKNKYLLKKIFEKIGNKRKLNIIKYNKRIKVKLKINKNDFEIYATLKEFNDKYNSNIEDIDNKDINLSLRNIGNEGLKNLVKIKFKRFKELNLSYNNISEINVFEKVDFKQLNKLDLRYNEISDINILEKINFKELKKLNLGYNKISDINILEKVDFKELNKLNLSHNVISDINILEKFDFQELIKLDLSYNKISDKNILEKIFKFRRKSNL